MFILELLPDNIVLAVIGGTIAIGIIGFIIDYILYYIPFLTPYRIFIKVSSIIILLFGVYLTGAYTTELVWKKRVAEVQEQVAIAAEKSQHVNTVVQEKIVNKIKLVEKKVIVNHNIIKKEKEIINAECKIPDLALKIYNTSVLGDAYE